MMYGTDVGLMDYDDEAEAAARRAEDVLLQSGPGYHQSRATAGDNDESDAASMVVAGENTVTVDEGDP